MGTPGFYNDPIAQASLDRLTALENIGAELKLLQRQRKRRRISTQKFAVEIGKLEAKFRAIERAQKLAMED